MALSLMPTVEEHDDIVKEWLKCDADPIYFVDQFCYIYEASGNWIPFKLWPEQVHALQTIHDNPLTIILKARQLGITWIGLSYALWLMLFRPAATISIFSRRQEEANYLLGTERLRGMFNHLPLWMRYQVTTDNTQIWQLSNGSIARAFPTSAGDSYTASYAFADEFDLVEDQNKLIGAVKPTVDGGGKMVLVSRADKSRPRTEFKKIYQAARRNDSPWKAVFIPWYARPGRDEAWYKAMKKDSLNRTASLDDLYEQYPANDAEALSPKSQDKRLPAIWLQNCWDERAPLLAPSESPAIAELRLYSLPRTNREYKAGVDPAEGNPLSDESSIDIVDSMTGEQVAQYSGRVDPEVFADYVRQVCEYYNTANALVERNNHGHTVIAWLQNNAAHVSLLLGNDGKPGWLTTTPSKTAMYDELATLLRESDCTIHDMDTYAQLASIDGTKLRAPDKLPDDRAISFALAQQARSQKPEKYVPQASAYVQGAIPVRAKVPPHSVVGKYPMPTAQRGRN